MNQKQDKHIIDVLFVIGLFCLFALSSIFLITIGANIYRKTVSHMNENFNTRTSLSYVTEKIRQADESGAISLGTLDGNPTLILSSKTDDTIYHTYIYEYQGMLKELLERSDVSLQASAGQDIMDVEKFEMVKVNGHLLQCTLKMHGEDAVNIYISIRSEGFENVSE